MPDSSPFPTVVLAGGSGRDRLAAAAGLPVKALIPLRGRPLVDYVVAAVHEAAFGPIVVATAQAAAEPIARALGDRAQVRVAKGPRITDTLLAGMAAFPDAPRVLLATADLPLLTPESIRHFTDEAERTGADFVYSVVRREDLPGPYAAGRRLLVRLGDLRLTGGNLFFITPAFMQHALPVLERAFANRKNPITLAGLLGFSFIIRFLLGRLDIPTIIRRAEPVLGCSAAVVISPFPEVSFDIDRPVQLEVAERVLADRDKA